MENPQWLSLRFGDPDREEAFLLWLVPQPRWSNTAIMFLIGVFLFVYVSSIGGFTSGASSATPLLVSLTLAICLSMLDAICVTWSRVADRSTKENVRLIKATDILFCTYIVDIVVMEIALTHFFVFQDCATDVSLFADSRQVYREANCYRRFVIGAATLLTFLPLKRIRFVNSLVTAAVVTVVTAITLAVWPHRYLALTIGHIVVVAALLVFISFVHYLIERDARKYFATRERLHAYTEDVQARADALEAYVGNLLPPALLARSSRNIAAHKHDVSDAAVVLMMGVPDFTAQSTTWIPSELALAIETAHGLLFTELEQSPLQRVSVVLDEVIAVGNLLRSDNVARCVVEACSVADQTLRSVAEGIQLSHHAAVDVGAVTGGFLGTTHVRYDVWGEAVRTARNAINFAATNELVLTDSARYVAQSALEVREGPTMDGSEGSAVWIFCACSHAAYTEELAFESVTSPIDSDTLGTKSSRRSSQTGDPSGSDNSNRNVLTQAVRLTGAVKADGLASKYAMQQAWLAYQVFADPDTEAAFVEQRQRTMLARAGRMWLGYAALVIVLMAVLVADLDEHRGGMAVVLMTLAALLSVGVAVTAGHLENSPGKHTVWCIVSLLVPLLTIYAGAVGRPSALGNDMRHLLIIGAIVRGPSFRHARHQLVVVPILAVVFHTHLLLPGAIFLLPTFLYITLVFFVMVTDQENDMSQRHNFIAEREIEQRLQQLELEESVRMGLVLTTLPIELVQNFHSMEPGKLRSTIQPDSAVILVTRLPPKVGGDSAMKQSPSHQDPTVEVERVAEQCPSLTIVKLFGDNVLLVNPICGSKNDGQVSSEAELERCTDILRLYCLLQERDQSSYQMLAEVDTTNQLLEKVSGLPSFKVMGIAVSRVLAIGSSGAAILPGLLLTDRAHTMLKLSGSLQRGEGGPWTERPLPPWRVRGIGMLRLVQMLPPE